MLAVLLFISLFRALQGAPENTTTNFTSELEFNTFTTRSDPPPYFTWGTRATSDIVLSCVATILACTWTAIHPNVPGPYDSSWAILKRRVVTTIYAFLAPEIVTTWAMSQRFAAMRIANAYNMEIATPVTPQPDAEHHSFFEHIRESIKEYFDGPIPLAPLTSGEVRPWTMTHGFLLQMGGFALLEDGVPTQTLQYHTDHGLLSLIGQGVIDPPLTTEAEIQDRSKGDFISKAVVVLQTSWFVAQCITRWATGLPVTELEVVTLGFAMLNGITYFLWWNKPQSVDVPVYLQVKNRIADSDKGVEEGNETEDVGPTERAPTENVDDTTTDKNSLLQNTEDDTEKQINIPTEEASLEKEKTESVDRAHSNKSVEEQDNRSIVSSQDSPKDVTFTRYMPPTRSFLPRKFEKDWEAHSAFRFFTFDVPYRLTAALLRPMRKMLGEATLAEGALRVSVFHSAEFEARYDNMVAICSSFIAVLFGLVHLIPSFFLDFNSAPEKWLWRASSIVITGEPVLLGLVVLYESLPENEVNPSLLYKLIKIDFFVVIFGVFALIGAPLYIAARVLLLVLALLSLRDLPHDAYITAEWIYQIPHL